MLLEISARNDWELSWEFKELSGLLKKSLRTSNNKK